MKNILFVYHELSGDMDDETAFVSNIAKVKNMLDEGDTINVVMPEGIWDKMKDTVSPYIIKAFLIASDNENYNETSYIDTVQEHCRKIGYTHIFMYSSILSRKIAGKLAVVAGVSSVADVFDIENHDGAFQYIRTTSENKLLSHIVCTRIPEIATLKLNFDIADNDVRAYFGETEVIKLPVGETDSNIMSIQKDNVSYTDYRKDVVVCIGRGVSPEIVPDIKEICKEKNIRLMGTRPMVEDGVISKRDQVGQSGVSINADTYIAIGVSGAMQHIIGVLNCKRIIAVNPDPNANIHQYANVSILVKIEKIIESRTLNDFV